MPTNPAGSERARIEFLLARDGLAATRAWVERTRDIYREAISSSGYGADPHYRALLQRSIEEFERWLAEHPGA
ncbi:MAG TPA: hypothetical protein VIL32_09560 [Steroidobacteraceae bacterium]